MARYMLTQTTEPPYYRLPQSRGKVLTNGEERSHWGRVRPACGKIQNCKVQSTLQSLILKQGGAPYRDPVEQRSGTDATRHRALPQLPIR